MSYKHTCIHYTGGLDDMQCSAGVRYDAVTPTPEATGSAYRRPCILWDKLGRHMSELQKREYAKRGACEKFTLPTPEQCAAHEVETTNILLRMKKVEPLIAQVRLKHKGESWSGTFDCPACGAIQSLTIGIASYNGHTRGWCRTKGCISFME